jgi:hypothetical protein
VSKGISSKTKTPEGALSLPKTGRRRGLGCCRRKGRKPFSEIQDFEGQYKLCYVDGPEGIILELAEQSK